MSLKRLYIFLFVIILALPAFTANAQFGFFSKNSAPKTGDEFVGPFNSWLNAKRDFHAAGNGTTDDTRALQTALDVLAKADKNTVLYLPAGIYLISHTLTLNRTINVSVIGADPKTTIIKWAGPAHGTMMQINGTAYSKFDRITWNGNKTADIAVDQSWDGNNAGHFDTSNEYADDIFTDVGFGIHGGHLGHGFAETSILRDQFIRNTIAGISLGNFNALDIWVRNCLFENCARGITNEYGAGNFKAYRNIFRNSTDCDMTINNTGEFAIRDNFSINSNQFFAARGSSNPASTIITGNTILDPIMPTPVAITNQGPTVFIGNIVRSRPALKPGPIVFFSRYGNSNTYCAGNTFTQNDPVYADGTKIVIDNKTVAPADLRNIAQPVFVGNEPNLNRRVFDVPAGANSAAIQDIVNQATKAGNRAVVHFSFGKYTIANTINIPANSDVQLVGDCYGDQHGTTLYWAGAGIGPIIQIVGPSKATLRDITLKGSATSTNIKITNADQPSSRVYLQGFNQINGQTGLLANGLDRTVILGQDIEFSGLQKAVSVVGGSGRVIIYSGATSNNAITNEVKNGGNLVVNDCWYEGGIKSTFIKLSGNSTFVATGDHIYVPVHTEIPAVLAENFSGRALFVGDYFTDRFVATGDCSRAKILGLGLMTENDPVVDASAAKTDLRLSLIRTREHSALSHSGSRSVPDVGVYNQNRVNDMLSVFLTVKQATLNPLPNNITDVRLFKVMSIGGAVGLDVEPKAR